MAPKDLAGGREPSSGVLTMFVGSCVNLAGACQKACVATLYKPGYNESNQQVATHIAAMSRAWCSLVSLVAMSISLVVYRSIKVPDGHPTLPTRIPMLPYILVERSKRQSCLPRRSKAPRTMSIPRSSHGKDA